MRATPTIGYTLSKISLSKDKVLKVYFYEQGDQGELVLSVDPDDINKARNSLGRKLHIL